MINSANSRRNALAMSIGWWYLRRLIRKRGTAAVAGYVAGEGLSFARRPRKRHPLRWLIVHRACRCGRPVLVAQAAGRRRRLGRLGAGRTRCTGRSHAGRSRAGGTGPCADPAPTTRAPRRTRRISSARERRRPVRPAVPRPAATERSGRRTDRGRMPPSGSTRASRVRSPRLSRRSRMPFPG